jgi:hypothetical protein
MGGRGPLGFIGVRETLARRGVREPWFSIGATGG